MIYAVTAADARRTSSLEEIVGLPMHQSLLSDVPPVVVDGDALDIDDVDGFKLRVKFFDYGVLSLALSRSFAGEWAALLDLRRAYIENAELERRAETIARRIFERFAAVVKRGRATFLSEDYLVVSITAGGSWPRTAPVRARGEKPVSRESALRANRGAPSPATCERRFTSERRCYTNLVFEIGNSRTRFPVAAKMALASAGMIGARHGQADPHDRSAFELRAHAIGIDDGSRVDDLDHPVTIAPPVATK